MIEQSQFIFFIIKELNYNIVMSLGSNNLLFFVNVIIYKFRLHHGCTYEIMFQKYSRIYVDGTNIFYIYMSEYHIKTFGLYSDDTASVLTQHGIFVWNG